MLAVLMLFMLLSVLASTEAGPAFKKTDAMDEVHLSDLCTEITDNEAKKENCLKCFLDIREPEKNKSEVLRCAEYLPGKLADCVKKMAQFEGKKKYEKCNKSSVEIAARIEREEKETEIEENEQKEEGKKEEISSVGNLAAVEDAMNGDEKLEDSEKNDDDDDDPETEKTAEIEQEEEQTEAKIERDDEETKRMDSYWKDCFEDLLDKLLSRISQNSSQDYEKISTAISHCTSEKGEEAEEAEGVKAEEETAEAGVKEEEEEGTEELRVDSVKGKVVKADIDAASWNSTDSSLGLEHGGKVLERHKREESEISSDSQEDKDKEKIECQVKAISEDKELVEIMKEAVLQVEFPIPYQIVRLLLTET